MNWLIFNNFNCSRHVRLKSIRRPIIFIIFVIFFIFAFIVLLITYRLVLGVPLIIWSKSTWNIQNAQYTMHNSKRLVATNKIRNFSKFRCTGDENNINAWPERLCVFNNICYNVKMQQFEYYRRLRSPKFPLFYDSSRGMLSEFIIKQNGRHFLSLTSRGGESWAPMVVDNACPSVNVTWLTNLHTLWREYFDDNNFGHLVWEDIGSIFYSLERMNEFDEQFVVMHVTPVSKDPNFQKFLDNILAVITSRKVVEYKTYLTTLNTSYVCFRHFIAGGNMLLIHSSAMKENHGRENLLYKWRSKIIRYHKFDPEYIPNQHRIVITNKSASIFAKVPSGMHRAIANLNEVVTFVRNTYPNIPIEVIEWHKMSFVKQIGLLLNTTILISPAGGVSMIAPFLPHGSHAILMDYYVTQNSFGFDNGSSASMEGMLLNHFPHFKKDYYQIYGKQDYVFDFDNTTDTRNDASIIINVTRLHLLIESALEDMNI